MNLGKNREFVARMLRPYDSCCMWGWCDRLRGKILLVSIVL
ncbi:hypothetical protein [Anabaena sp. UHCC 0253]|nr:hypothetical protein [Anabaena sp. UHCC 0253]